jgi:hypothetical protein
VDLLLIRSVESCLEKLKSVATISGQVHIVVTIEACFLLTLAQTYIDLLSIIIWGWFSYFSYLNVRLLLIIDVESHCIQ